MAILVQDMNKKTVKFQEQSDSANTAMKNLKLKSDVQKEVIYYLLSTQPTQDQQEDLKQFLDQISPSLRLKISSEIFSVTLERNNVLKGLGAEERSEILANIVKKLEIVLTTPEQALVKQGMEDAREMYFV